MQMHRDKSIGLFYAPLLLTIWISSGNGTENNLNDWDSGGSLINKIIGTDVFFEIIDPPELEYTYKLKPAKDFGAPFNASFMERRIALVPTEPPTCCQRAENADWLKGNVALVQRGECSFLIKATVAEEAGAKAIIITDYPTSLEDARTSPLWMDHYYVEMVRDNTVSQPKPVNIPAGFLLGKNGKMIRETLRRLNLSFALINIPVNLTYTPINKLHQPPWISW